MNVLSYTHLRQHLARVMTEVCDQRTPVVVTRQNAEPVVMMSLEEFNALQETLHLLGNPRNAQRLMDSIAEAEAGRLAEHRLSDE